MTRVTQGLQGLADVHTHFIPEDVMSWLKENKERVRAKWENRGTAPNQFLSVNEKWAFELKPAFIEAELYLKEQERAGVHFSLVSPIPQLFLYEFDPALTTELAQVYNRSLAQWIKKHPERLSALATLPLNDPQLAADELERAMQEGLKGAIIGPGTGEWMLSDEPLHPLWGTADRLGAIIFIHPLLAEDPRLKRRMMPNLIGVPWETTLCATDLLLSGLVDRYPHVKILLAHGGGFLPYQIGRLDKGYTMWPQVSDRLEAPPSSYLKRFWYDSVVWEPRVLTFLEELVGPERIVPGSDYPFDLSVWPPSGGNEGLKSLLG